MDRITEGPDAALRSGKVQLWPVFAIRPDRKRVFHITDPWMTTERCLVSVGPPKDSRRGETVVYGRGMPAAITAYPSGAHLVHKDGGGHPLALCGQAAAVVRSILRRAVAPPARSV